MKLILAIATLLLANVANSQTDTEYNDGATAVLACDTPGSDNCPGGLFDASEDGSTHTIQDSIDVNTWNSLEETGQTQEEADLTESTLGTPPH